MRSPLRKTQCLDFKRVRIIARLLCERCGKAKKLCVVSILGAVVVALIALGIASTFRSDELDVDKMFANALVLGSRESVKTYPDYSDRVVPCNIAPLNFTIRKDGAEFVTRFSVEGGDYAFAVVGKLVRIDRKRWRRLMEEAVGKRVVVEIFARRDDQVWREFRPLYFSVSSDPIDAWLHYRLVEPGYEYFNRVKLVERCLETFEERTWFDAKAVNERTCVNCHTFQDRKTDRFLFHTRRALGGTILCEDGKVKKVEPKLLGDPLGVAYAAWNPKADLVAFSSNSTFQMFHSLSYDRVEVVDAASDLVLFDAGTAESTSVCKTDDVLETFPSWAPDGRALFYCAAKSPYYNDKTAFEDKELKAQNVFDDDNDKFAQRRVEAVELYDRFHYNLTRRSFDLTTRTFGEPETLVDAESLGKSIAHPRVSPDGKTIVYTLSKYGAFPIWRRDADLWSYDLTTGETRELTELNSAESESWHEWDSSGRWLIFSSRRDDGTLTRVYIAHYAADGTWSKPFVLPQLDPRSDIELVKSYNLPTPTVEPIKVAPRKLTHVARRP